MLLCQTFVTASGVIVQGGDSGSPVFAIYNGGNNVTLLGGLWGGNQSGTQFVYSPIANIEAELGDTDHALSRSRPPGYVVRCLSLSGFLTT